MFTNNFLLSKSEIKKALFAYKYTHTRRHAKLVIIMRRIRKFSIDKKLVYGPSSRISDIERCRCMSVYICPVPKLVDVEMRGGMYGTGKSNGTKRVQGLEKF